MNQEQLIAAVFKNTPVWDKKHKLYSNRKTLDKCWKDISKVMKEDEEKLKKKWKYLRDQFCVELGKIPPSKLGDPANSYTVTWPHFKSLLFLKGIVRPRPLRSRSNAYMYGALQDEIHSSGIASPVLPRPSQDDFLDPNDSESFAPGKIESSSSKRNIKGREPVNTFNESMLEIEHSKQQYLNGISETRDRKEDEDEHSHFFKSLLPHVRFIPQQRLLTFRGRMQELVQEFVYKDFSPQPSLSIVSVEDANYQKACPSHKQEVSE